MRLRGFLTPFMEDPLITLINENLEVLKIRRVSELIKSKSPFLKWSVVEVYVDQRFIIMLDNYHELDPRRKENNVIARK